MKVHELIAILQEHDPNATVLSEDNDRWFYDIFYVDTGKVSEGRINEECGEYCVLLRT